ncbi:hypothetical protein SAMN05216308_1441, partial [Nitrosospira sp. Nsp13]
MSNKLAYKWRKASIDASLRPVLVGGLKGIEKESLRITRAGALSQ